MLLRYITLIALALALLVPFPARAGDLPQLSLSELFHALDDDPTLPEQWGGIWDTEIETRLCDSPVVLFSSSQTDTLCPGETADPGETDPEVTVQCTGTATETRIDMTCTFSQTLFDGACTVNSVIQYESVRNGESYTATIRNESTATGECFDTGNFCSEITITGTRVGPAPASCATPVENVTWGTIKNRYE